MWAQEAPGGQPAAAGLRRTPQRTAVLDALGRCPDFVSAQDLHARMAAEGSTVGLTTVYRALRELERAGLVDVVRDDAEGRLYLRRPAGEHRHYVICRRCSRSRPVDAEVVELWAGQLGETTGFTELEHTLELSGVCAHCRTATEGAPHHPGPRLTSPHGPRPA